MIGIRKSVTLFVFSLFLSSNAWSAPVIYDLAGGWSDATNPNGVWTYREGANALPSVSNWTPLNSSVSQPAWAPSATSGNFLPAWFQSTSDNPSSLDVLTGDIVTHTTDNLNGPGHGPSNVLWTSPSAGTMNVSGGVWIALDRGRSNDWSIYLNDVLLTGGSISSGDAYDRSAPFLFSNGSGGASALSNLIVSSGDELRLEFAKTSTYGEFVGVDLQVQLSPVPIPATFLLLLSGLAGIGIIGGKRKIV